MTTTETAPAKKQKKDAAAHVHPHPAVKRESAAEAKARAQACYEEMRVVLERHNCRIDARATLSVEAVGSDGAGALTRAVAQWGVVPNPLG